MPYDWTGRTVEPEDPSEWKLWVAFGALSAIACGLLWLVRSAWG